MTKLCAEAMGLRLIPAYRKGTILYDEGQHDWNGLMYSRDGNHLFVQSGAYNPLHDDAQALALVKKFDLCVEYEAYVNERHDGWIDDWRVRNHVMERKIIGRNPNLNRAIVEAVATLQQERATATVQNSREEK
jgi:hypothetical protein